ncbi:hypothetical protein ACLM5J_06825 [Nocardioides sp. Bht2]|uniref:hypothetical protein n=1 Tax=Nocardioides sp. Bht2 TaxID=3392297 RepID=UPI0039B4AD1D
MSDPMFNVALNIVERAQLASRIERYKTADRPVNTGGRKLSIPSHVAVTLLLIQALEGDRACHVTTAATNVLQRLSPEQCTALGIQVPTVFEKRSSAAHKRWRDRIHASLDALFRLIDPHWNPNRRNRWLKADWNAHMQARDPDIVERKMERLYDFNNAILRATTELLPAKYREKFQGARAVDGTSYRTSCRGTSEKSNRMSVEPNAWWYNRNSKDKKLDNTKPKFHGYEATLFIWTKEFTNDPDEYPFLVDAMAHNPPAKAASEIVVRAARTLFENNAKVSTLRADNQYWAGQNIDKFHQPLWTMGFKPVTSYRSGQRGLQGEAQHGAVRIDGDLYCPSILDAPNLVNVGDDYMSGRIDRDKVRERIAAREPYLLKNKHKTPFGDKRVMMCPAKRGTLDCSLRQDLSAANDRLGLPIFPVASAGAICDNKHSTTFGTPSKFEQEYRYLTDEWFEAYGQRSQVESFNNDLKNSALGSRNGIRLRGFAAVALVSALCVASVNVQRINTFVARKTEEAEGRRSRAASRSRSRRKSGWTDDLETTPTPGDDPDFVRKEPRTGVRLSVEDSPPDD